MKESQLDSKADPELMRQLNATTASDEPVEAVVRLNPVNPSEIVPSPDKTEQLTQQVLKRVGERVGNSENRYNVFKNLGYFVVSADKSFIRELISQPEVAAAVANEQPGSAAMPPVKTRAVPSLERKKVSTPMKKSAARTPARKAAGKSAR